MIPVRAAALAIAAVVAQQAGAQQPVFRSGTDLITVPVSVRSSGAPVGGLNAGDFFVTDNGVRQAVEVLSAQVVPADITIIVETSEALAPYLVSIDGQMRKIVSMIRPTDRYEILGASTYVDEIVPMREARLQPPLPPLKPKGLSSINDAIVAALLRQPDAERPHLIIVLSDTIDTMSRSTVATVARVAKYSSSTLVVAWLTMDLAAVPFESPRVSVTSERQEVQQRVATTIMTAPRALHGGIQGGVEGARGSYSRVAPKTGGWHPHYLPARGRRLSFFDPLKEAAEASGGAVYLPGIFANRTASAIFEKLYADYRSRYVLRYERTGAPGEGWHDVAITIPRLPKAEIAAKRGYFVDKK